MKVKADDLQIFPPRRTVAQTEALAWLTTHVAAPGTSVITSLPDVSEVSLGFEPWRAWFVRAARQIVQWVPDDGVAIFYQSDIRHEGAWVDKGFLVSMAADTEKATLLWHKIVCRKPPGAISSGRPTYSHMLCFSRSPRPNLTRPGPDVLADAGHMPWNRAMGETACKVACRFLRDETPTRVVVDPFCGEGTALAVANAFGFEAVGVDLSARRCRIAVEQTAQFAATTSGALAQTEQALAAMRATPKALVFAVEAALADPRAPWRELARRAIGAELAWVERRDGVELVAAAFARGPKDPGERLALFTALAFGPFDPRHAADPTNRRAIGVLSAAIVDERDAAVQEQMATQFREVLSTFSADGGRAAVLGALLKEDYARLLAILG